MREIEGKKIGDGDGDKKKKLGEAVREIETKMSDARICVIKMLERNESVGSQRWKENKSQRE